MPDVLLHWHCRGVTYSVKRLTVDKAYLLASGPAGEMRRGRRDLALSTVSEWGKMTIDERCRLAEGELGPVPRARPA